MIPKREDSIIFQKTVCIIRRNKIKTLRWFLLSGPSENKHDSHKKVSGNKDFCNIVIPSKKT